MRRVINPPVKIGGRVKRSPDLAKIGLHNEVKDVVLVIMIVPGGELVAVDDKNLSLLAGSEHLMRIIPRLVGQQHQSAGAEVGVLGLQGGLIPRCEIISYSQPVGRRQFHEAVAVIHLAGIVRGAETSIADHKIEVAVIIHA